MKELFLREGYVLIGTDKCGSKKKYKYICPNGHTHSIRRDHWMKGARCPFCAGNARLDIDYIRENFERAGYKLLTTEYNNSKQMLETVCPNGHLYKTKWNNWFNGYGCSICSNRAKKDIVDIAKVVEKEGYKLLSKEYKNNKTKLDLECPNGHLYKVSWDNWTRANSRCTVCSKTGTSIQEEELHEHIKKLCPEVVRFNRQLIKPYELDFVIPSLKTAIEYCGLYWHSESFGKNKEYHKNKFDLCNNVGYRLITIFEDEFVSKKEIVLSKLENILRPELLNNVSNKDCVIREINFIKANKFCKENHLQGGVHDSFLNLGAFVKGTLLGVIIFSKQHKTVLELERFCVKPGVNAESVFSKIIKYFNINYNYSILSYIDLRWFSDTLHISVGFKYLGITKPSYWYFKNNKKRIRGFTPSNVGSTPKEIIEFESKEFQGWNRIWDCGNLKCLMEKDS